MGRNLDKHLTKEDINWLEKNLNPELSSLVFNDLNNCLYPYKWISSDKKLYIEGMGREGKLLYIEGLEPSDKTYHKGTEWTYKRDSAYNMLRTKIRKVFTDEINEQKVTEPTWQSLTSSQDGSISH